LTEMFWGDQDEDRARHSLSDALSHLRRVLGRNAIAARQSEVFLSCDADLRVDAAQVTTAAGSGDWAAVVARTAVRFYTECPYAARRPSSGGWRSGATASNSSSRGVRRQMPCARASRRWDECAAPCRALADLGSSIRRRLEVARCIWRSHTAGHHGIVLPD
jgi:hypothetical protein